MVGYCVEMWIKKLFKGIFLSLLTLLFAVLSTLMWIYMSANVDKLTEHYPLINPVDKSFEVVWVKEKPSDWVSLKQMSKYAHWSIVLKEDWAFYQHPGVDFNQIRIAIIDHFKKGKRVRGASTITQQLVKNLFLSPSRSLWRKLKELFYTYKLEKKFSKHQILEYYLNIIEVGRDLFGIKQAALHYFGISPKDLTPKQSAFIAMLLPSPRKYSYSFRKKELTEFAKFEIDQVLIKLRMANIYDEEDRLIAIKECFDWELNCDPDLVVDRLSEKTQHPGPIIDKTKNN